MPNAEVTRNDARSRFELTLDGALAGVLEYRLTDGVADLFHTEVFEAFGGRGWGAVLVRHALDAARAEGWRITPSCWFVRGYLAEHPEEADLLA